MESSNISKLNVNFFEYCIVQENTPLPTNKVKVKIPKLTTSTNKGRVRANFTILINDSDCKPTQSGFITLSDSIIVKTFSGLEISKSVVKKYDEHGNLISMYLPKGAQMIVCFMENNIDDCYLTNML